MSYDYNIQIADSQTGQIIGACDHEISFERYTIDPDDFRTLHYLGNQGLNMRAPINGANNIRIWIRGESISPNDPIYSWSIIRDTNRVDIPTADVFYKILFDRPIRLVIPLIEVTYLTRQPYCMKCNGIGVLSDFKASSSGDFLHITQTNKLAQKALKWILTSNCPFYPTFVCQLKNYIGRKLGIQITETDIQTQVLNALTQMQQVQRAQSTVQSLDPSEIIKDIINVTAVIDPNDPTLVRVSATVSSFSGTSAPLGFTLRMNP